MKIFSKDFYILSNNPKITIEDIRKKLLSWMLVLLILLGLPAVIIGVVEAVELKQAFIAISYLSFFSPILIALIFQKKIPFKLSVFFLLFSGYSIGVINIVIYGFSGAGLPIFYTIIVLSTIFWGMRAGFITLLSCVIPMVIIAYLMTNSILSLGVDLNEISKYPISWISAISIMIFLGGIMIFGYGIIHNNLLRNLKLVREQAGNLQIVNQKLEEDIKQRQIVQKELEISKDKAEESDRLKSEFINNMSHEIRTPLNGILGFSNLLNKGNLTDDKRKQFVSIIQNSGMQLIGIIDDMMDISELVTKQAKLQNEKVCLNDLLLELYSIFEIKAKEKNILLYLKKGLHDTESTIFIDRKKLYKTLYKLLENAIKFTEKGSVEYGCQLKINGENTFMEIYIKDTGIGIRPENKESVFVRFSQEDKGFSRNVGGLGLGLSIAKENAELLGGKITMKSEKENPSVEKKGGSTFYVTLPYKIENL